MHEEFQFTSKDEYGDRSEKLIIFRCSKCNCSEYKYNVIKLSIRFLVWAGRITFVSTGSVTQNWKTCTADHYNRNKTPWKKDVLTKEGHRVIWREPLEFCCSWNQTEYLVMMINNKVFLGGGGKGLSTFLVSGGNSRTNLHIKLTFYRLIGIVKCKC